MWRNSLCDFYMRNCSCGSCEDDNVQCEGEDHHSKHSLSSPFHALAYEVECHDRALWASHVSHASQIIHFELGQGHSNYPEAFQNVQAKDKYLHSIHYMLSTNMGLMQANTTWLNKKNELHYHWPLAIGIFCLFKITCV